MEAETLETPVDTPGVSLIRASPFASVGAEGRERLPNAQLKLTSARPKTHNFRIIRKKNNKLQTVNLFVKEKKHLFLKVFCSLY
ncbi:MAG: hypothetical protein P9X24_05460, partial [Candidatus Hatepunaea meridiana]|nr:hypothetical protein [Candidatus Hatepunaea meridiana]